MLQKLSGQVNASLQLQEISTLLIQEGNLDALTNKLRSLTRGCKLISTDYSDAGTMSMPHIKGLVRSC
jgi:hypothetical protein